MTMMETIAALPKVLVCLFFAVALVLFPASASHAASGMHGSHQVESNGADNVDVGHSHGAASSHSTHGKTDAVSNTGDADQSSDHCCSGICVSEALGDTDIAFVKHPRIGKYVMHRAQTVSIEPSGFLRPPQNLI